MPEFLGPGQALPDFMPFLKFRLDDVVILESGMSPNTIQSYRDSLALLLRHVACWRKLTVADLDLSDIDPKAILAFLSYLERDRKNGVTTRNVRLSAIHAFFRYVGEETSRSSCGLPMFLS